MTASNLGIISKDTFVSTPYLLVASPTYNLQDCITGEVWASYSELCCPYFCMQCPGGGHDPGHEVVSVPDTGRLLLSRVWLWLGTWKIERLPNAKSLASTLWILIQICSDENKKICVRDGRVEAYALIPDSSRWPELWLTFYFKRIFAQKWIFREDN